MKTQNTNIPKTSLTLPVMAFACLLMLSSCARTVSFNSSAVVPAAKGYTKLTHDKNKNYILEINVKHLAGPERLTPPKDVYVVWLQTEQNGVTNVGQLKISGSLSGYLKTTTSFKPVKVFITAEQNANIKVPTGRDVMSSTSF